MRCLPALLIAGLMFGKSGAGADVTATQRAPVADLAQSAPVPDFPGET
jgi:hypothetical protein